MRGGEIFLRVCGIPTLLFIMAKDTEGNPPDPEKYFSTSQATLFLVEQGDLKNPTHPHSMFWQGLVQSSFSSAASRTLARLLTTNQQTHMFSTPTSRHVRFYQGVRHSGGAGLIFKASHPGLGYDWSFPPSAHAGHWRYSWLRDAVLMNESLSGVPFARNNGPRG